MIPYTITFPRKIASIDESKLVVSGAVINNLSFSDNVVSFVLVPSFTDYINEVSVSVEIQPSFASDYSLPVHMNVNTITETFQASPLIRQYQFKLDGQDSSSNKNCRILNDQSKWSSDVLGSSKSQNVADIPFLRRISAEKKFLKSNSKFSSKSFFFFVICFWLVFAKYSAYFID